MTDGKTLEYYNENADFYGNVEPNPANEFFAYRNKFIDKLNPGSRILDLGCGGGHDTLAFLQSGFDVTALDGSTELARIASQRANIDVVVKNFSQLDYQSEFDGIWACASLTHVSLGSLDEVMRLVCHALRPKGWLYASFKCSEEDWRDAKGRFYSAISPDALYQYAHQSGFDVDKIEIIQGHGCFQDPTMWAWLSATRISNS